MTAKGSTDTRKILRRFLMARWQKGHRLQEKNLFAQTNLLLLHIAVDHRRDTTEEVRDARNLKLIDHIRARFS